MNRFYDIIVVGAGLAGLSGARYLSLAGKRILILEARNRVGGRVLSKFQGSIPIDLGAQWIQPGQNQIYELLESFGIKTYPSYQRGNHIFATGKKIRPYSGAIPKIGFPAKLEVRKLIQKLKKQSAKINPETPWTSDTTHHLDVQKFSDFIKKRTWFNASRNLVNTEFETLMGCHASEISMLQALFYFRSGCNLKSLFQENGGVRRDRVAGGMQLLATNMANELDVLLCHPVSSIKHFKGGVEVAGKDFSYKARHVLVAIPPNLARNINFRPQIRNEKRKIWDSTTMGKVLKCIAIYDHPFWRKDGLSGRVVIHEKQPLQAIYDNSSETHPHGILMGLSIGHRAENLMQLSESKREGIILKTFSSFFGPKAENAITYLEKSWFSDPWSQSGYSGHRKPGLWNKYQDALIETSGRVHWAGTETSSLWNGHMEGAVRSGIRAAKEILSD